MIQVHWAKAKVLIACRLDFDSNFASANDLNPIYLETGSYMLNVALR